MREYILISNSSILLNLSNMNQLISHLLVHLSMIKMRDVRSFSKIGRKVCMFPAAEILGGTIKINLGFQIIQYLSVWYGVIYE